MGVHEGSRWARSKPQQRPLNVRRCLQGLVHKNELSWDFVRDPGTVVQPGQQVRVKVITLEPNKQRLGLSLKRLQVSAPVLGRSWCHCCQRLSRVAAENSKLDWSPALPTVHRPEGDAVHSKKAPPRALHAGLAGLLSITDFMCGKLRPLSSPTDSLVDMCYSVLQKDPLYENLDNMLPLDGSENPELLQVPTQIPQVLSRHIQSLLVQLWHCQAWGRPSLVTMAPG